MDSNYSKFWFCGCITHQECNKQGTLKQAIPFTWLKANRDLHSPAASDLTQTTVADGSEKVAKQKPPRALQ